MIAVKVRIYRSHDYDLMVLAKTGAIDIAPVAKAVLEACFLGKEYHLDGIEDRRDKIPESLGNSMNTRVDLSDDECPGIEAWFGGFGNGSRNNLIKCLIRRAIGEVPMWVYRRDGWASAQKEAEEVQAVLADISREEKAREESKTEKKDPAAHSSEVHTVQKPARLPKENDQTQQGYIDIKEKIYDPSHHIENGYEADQTKHNNIEETPALDVPPAAAVPDKIEADVGTTKEPAMDSESIGKAAGEPEAQTQAAEADDDETADEFDIMAAFDALHR